MYGLPPKLVYLGDDFKYIGIELSMIIWSDNQFFVIIENKVGDTTLISNEMSC